MSTFLSFIGQNKAIALSLVIVVFTSLAARVVFAKEPSAHSKASRAIVQAQKVKEDTKDAYDAYSAASELQERALACLQGGDCSVFQ